MQQLTFKRQLAIAAATIIAALIAVMLVMPTQAFAVTAAEKQAEAEEALAQLNAMQETLDQLSAEYGEAVMAQEAAEASRDAAAQRIEEISGEIAQLQEYLGSRAREMYRSGSTTFLDILLGANSFEEFATSWDLLMKVNQSNADMVAQQKVLRAEAEEQEAIFAEQAAIAAQKTEEAAAAEAQAEATVAEMQSIYDSLSAEAAELLEQERAAAAAAEAARIEAERRAAAESGGSGSGGGSGYVFDDEVVEPYEGGSDPVSRAYACLGAPYVWGGVGPYGYDCSGLVSYCLLGYHSRLGTTNTFMGWDKVDDPQPGDVCTNWGHCGIYIGGGQMIHASTYGVGVIIGPVQSGMIIVRW